MQVDTIEDSDDDSLVKMVNSLKIDGEVDSTSVKAD